MIAALKRLFEWYRWCGRIAWLLATDRWFIFRDAPLHVVARFAAFEDDVDPDFQRAIDEARQELALRVRVLEAEVARALFEATRHSLTGPA